MGVPLQNKKEFLGLAYVRAIIAKAGFLFAKSESDFGLDGTIKDVTVRNGRYHENGIGIEFQLKSSQNVQFVDGNLVYDLESKNYNDLALWEGTFPSILILFVLPDEEDSWLSQTTDCLEIRQCAWWYCLEGSPETSNDFTQRIRIPETQVFSPEALDSLMEKARRGDKL